MRKTNTASITAITFVLVAICCSFMLFACAKKENAEETVQGSPIAELKFLVLEGSPYNRGFMHGKTFKSEITQLVDLWKSGLQRQYGTDPDEFITQFLEETDYLPAIKEFTPDLLEEVKGIAEGSDFDFSTIFAFQLLDEFILNGADILGGKCTSVGVNRIGDKPALMGQNWDIAGVYNHFQTVFHIRHENPDVESYVFSYPGFIGALGLNNQNVGVCVNGMYELNYAREGLPVAFIVRGLLEKSSQKDAIAFLHDIRHASPQNYLIGGPDRIVAYECSANKVFQFQIAENPEVVYHTNHTLINDDFTAKYLEYRQGLQESGKENAGNQDDSRMRYSSMAKRMSIPPDDITINQIKAALASHDSKTNPVCRSYVSDSHIFSLASVVMVFSDDPEFHIAPGSPDVTPFKVYKFIE